MMPNADWDRAIRERKESEGFLEKEKGENNQPESEFEHHRHRHRRGVSRAATYQRYVDGDNDADVNVDNRSDFEAK